MTTTPQDLKTINKVRKSMGKEPLEESKEKKRSIGKLAGSMLFVAWFLLGMFSIIVINESFEGLRDIHIFGMALITIGMVLCAILMFYISVVENEEHQQEQYQIEIKEILERGNDERYVDLIIETKSQNRTIEKIERFLIAQYGQHYDEQTP